VSYLDKLCRSHGMAFIDFCNATKFHWKRQDL